LIEQVHFGSPYALEIELRLCGQDGGVLYSMIQLIVGKTSKLDYQFVEPLGCTGLESCRN
jgi:hypothetical protein